MTTTIPIKEQGGFIICFEALPEDRSMREHFIGECGWSEKEFNRIRKYAWFTAKVSAWQDGEEIASDYLGACCYKKESEFYTKYADDYFKQMVDTVVKKAQTHLAFKADPKGVLLKELTGKPNS